jgi:hypothetical protein
MSPKSATIPACVPDSAHKKDAFKVEKDAFRQTPLHRFLPVQLPPLAKMIPDTLHQHNKDYILLQSREEETVVRRSQLKRGRSSARSNSSMTHLPPSRLRRTKSLPSALTDDPTSTGKPLFWFRAARQPPHQQSPPSIYKKNNSNHVRPPRPLLRFLGAPMRKMRRGSSIQMPYLTAEEGRNDSFATAVTVMAEDHDDDDDFDTTLIDYSDDEEDDEDFDDMEEEEVLRGLSFVDEQRE